MERRESITESKVVGEGGPLKLGSNFPLKWRLRFVGKGRKRRVMTRVSSHGISVDLANKKLFSKRQNIKIC